MNPKVSICIPTYQQPDFLRRTLKSVFAQSFEDYEVIITDDSPNDAVEKVVKEFQPNSKLKYYRNIERKGSPKNWNEAIRHASGEYIKFLHHDDWFSNKDSLQKFVKMLDDNPGADFAFCSSFAHSPDDSLLFVHTPSRRQLSKLRRDPEHLFPNNFIGAPSATIYRNKANQYFDNRIKWIVDIDFYLSLLRRNNIFAFCQEPLICITTGAASQVTSECANNKSVQLFEWLYLFKKLSTGSAPHFRQLKFILHLLIKYRVKSVNEIIEAGVEPPIPAAIRVMILFLNPIFR